MFHSPLVNYYWRRADKIKANPFTSKLAWCDHPRWSNYFAHAMVALLAASQAWHSNFDRDEQQVRFLAFRFAVQRISPTWRLKNRPGAKTINHGVYRVCKLTFTAGQFRDRDPRRRSSLIKALRTRCRRCFSSNLAALAVLSAW